MSVTGNLTLATPLLPFQKKVDLGNLKSSIVAKFQRRAHAGRAKVTQNKTSGNLIAQAKGAKHGLNLTAMYRAAEAPSKVPANGAQVAPPQVGHARGGAQAAVLAVQSAQASTPMARAQPGPTPDQRLAAARNEVDAIHASLADLARTQEKARGGGFSGRAANAELNFLTKRDAMQARIGSELASIDAALKDNPAAATRKELEGCRRRLIQLAVAVEYPKSALGALSGVSRTPSPAVLRAASAIKSGRAGFPALDQAAREFLASFATDASATLDPAVRSMLKDLVGQLERQRDNGGLTAEQEEALAYLNELTSAVDLAVTLDAAGEALDRLREHFRNDKELAKVSVGRLCREMSHLAPTMRGYAVSDAAGDHLTVLGTVEAIASEMARGVVPDVFASDDEGVKKMLSALRREHCENLAATKFLGTLDLSSAPELARALAAARRSGQPLTVAEIRQHLPAAHAQALDTAVKNGQAAAETREAYFRQLGNVARVLGDDTGAGALTAYKASIWAKLGVRQQDGSVLDVSRAAEKLKALGRKNPEAAFQVAGLAALEHRLILSDRDILGLPWAQDIDVLEFDPQRVMMLAGVTVEQMVKLGYSRDDAASFPESMLRLSKNFDNPAELRSCMRYFLHISRETLTNRGVQRGVGAFSHSSGPAIAQRTLNDNLSDVAAFGRGEATTTMDADLTAGSVDVVNGFRKVNEALTKAVADDDALAESLEASGITFAGLDARLVDEMRARANLEARVREARADICAASGEGALEGLDLNPDKPGSLKSAKAVLEAIEWDSEIMLLTSSGASAEEIRGATEQRDAALGRLRGFDAETMRRPWTARIAAVFNRGAQPDIGQLRSLRAVAENIVFLREGAGLERAEIDDRIAAVAQLRSDLAASRLSENPVVMETARQIIRSAILANWPASNAMAVVRDGHVVNAYEPAEHREKIEATLRSWGFDVEAFAPELSMELNGNLAAYNVMNWEKDLRPIDRATGLMTEPDGRSFLARLGSRVKTGAMKLTTLRAWKNIGIDAALYLVNKKRMDEQFKRDIFALAHGLKDGEKYDFKSGAKFSANSPKIPIDPYAISGVRAKMAVSGLSNFVLERSGDSIKITARYGGQTQEGVDIMADVKAPVDDRISAGVSIGGSLTETILNGRVVTFPNTDAGRTACSAFLLALVNNERPGPEAFEYLSEAANQRELGGKLDVNLKGYAKAEFTTQPHGNDGDFFSSAADDPSFTSGASNKLGVGLTSGAEIAASIGGKLKTTRSHDKAVYESEVELATGLTLTAGGYLKMPTVFGTMVSALMVETGAQAALDERFNTTKTKDDGSVTTKGQVDVASIGANEQFIGLEVGGVLVRTRKAKQEYAISRRPGGHERLTKAEITARSNLKWGPEVARIGIGSAELSARLDSDPEFRANFNALKRYMGRGDSLQITYAMKPDRLARANDLLASANDAATSGDTATAALLRARVKVMFLDEANYEPTKITVWTKTVLKDAANRGNALLARIDIIDESAHEDGQLVLAVPPRKAA